MKITRGSDHALIFFNRIVEKLSQSTTHVIKRKFSTGITVDEKVDIIQALEQHRHVFDEDTTEREAVNVAHVVSYDLDRDEIIVMANPKFLKKLKQTSFVK